MAYSEELADYVRAHFRARKDLHQLGIVEKKMFGGLSFLLNGHMSAGVMREDFVFRIDPEKTEEALGRKYARPMDFTGKQMRGFAYVSSDVLEDDDALEEWLDLSIQFVRTLKPKVAKAIVAKPKVTKAKVAKAKVAKPKVTKAKVAKAKVAKPKVTKAKVANAKRRKG